jgi:outer membrane lipoprotein LolB
MSGTLYAKGKTIESTDGCMFPYDYFTYSHMITVTTHSPLKYALTICLVVLLSACTSVPHKPIGIDNTEHQQQLSQLQNWQIKGRLGFKSPEKKFSASLNWQQNAENYQLTLNSILSIFSLEMHGRENFVHLNMDGKHYEDTDASLLLRRITGWQIPVKHFPSWIKGQTKPDDIVINSPEGWVQQIQPQCVACDGWIINYSNYKLAEDRIINSATKISNKSLWLPHKIVLNNPLNQSKIIIRVNSWLNN